MACLQACSKTHDPWQFYRIAAFSTAQERDLSIVIHFDQEPRCQTQREALLEAMQAENLRKMVAFRVEFGKEKNLEKTLGSPQPCSLYIFRGFQRRGQLGHETRPEKLKSFLRRAL